MSYKVVVGLGSNKGCRSLNIKNAVRITNESIQNNMNHEISKSLKKHTEKKEIANPLK